MAFPGLPWHCQPQGHQQRLRARLSPDGTLTGIPKINTKMNINTLEYMWCRVICIGNGYIVHMHEYIRKMAQSPRTLKKSYIRIVRKCVFNIHDSWIHTVGPNKCIECTQSLGPGFGGDELTTRSALKILKSTHHTSYTSAHLSWTTRPVWLCQATARVNGSEAALSVPIWSRFVPRLKRDDHDKEWQTTYFIKV